MDNDKQAEGVFEQIEMEVRMRDGVCKLLAACSQRDQALEASKTLVSCNCRILALLSQLQRMQREQVLQRVGPTPDQGLTEDLVPCLGHVAISDLRIPLMWKDSEYFKNKGELHRCAFFCLLQCGPQIWTTDVLIVDRTLTDICLEDNFIFRDVGPSFQLRVELYSSRLVADGSVGSRRGSLGVTAMGNFSGKKIRAAFESAAVCGSNGKTSPPAPSDPSALEPKFNRLAHVTLTLDHVRDGFKTHDLSLEATEESSFWLPLYGNICCRLLAQPQCMLTPAFCRRLDIELVVHQRSQNAWKNVHGVLMGRSLVCHPSEAEQESAPVLVIPLMKDARVCAPKPERGRPHCVLISTKDDGGNVVYAVTADDSTDWPRPFLRHLYSLEQWRQCCTKLMEFKPTVTDKPKAARQGSLFHEMVTPSAPSDGAVESSPSADIHGFFASYHKQSYMQKATDQALVTLNYGGGWTARVVDLT